MKRIYLSNKKKFVMVDDADYGKLAKHKWGASNHRGHWYAVESKKGNARMHRLIMDCPKGMEVDHINNNGLDNRKCNLRICTHQQNIMNSVSTTGESEYKGVSRDKRKKHKKWSAYIWFNYKKIALGIYKTQEEAAEAYNNGAKKYHGEYARLNKIRRVA